MALADPNQDPIASLSSLPATFEATAREELTRELDILHQGGKLTVPAVYDPDLDGPGYKVDEASSEDTPENARARRPLAAKPSFGVLPNASILAGLLAGPIARKLLAMAFDRLETAVVDLVDKEAAKLFPGLDAQILLEGIRKIFSKIRPVLTTSSV